MQERTPCPSSRPSHPVSADLTHPPGRTPCRPSRLRRGARLPCPGLCVCCTGILQLVRGGSAPRGPRPCFLGGTRCHRLGRLLLGIKEKMPMEQAAHNRSLRRGGCNHTLPNTAPWLHLRAGYSANIVTDLNPKPPLGYLFPVRSPFWFPRLPVCPPSFLLIISPRTQTGDLTREVKRFGGECALGRGGMPAPGFATPPAPCDFRFLPRSPAERMQRWG